MHRGLVLSGGAALVVFVAAVFVLWTRTPAPTPRAPSPEPRPHPRETEPARALPRPSEPERSSPAPPQSSAPPPGLRLGSKAGPEALVEAQAILDAALAELQRLDGSQRTLARDVYMRGHAAAERVEDELAEDDEPGRARLRADEDAMKAELRRIYGVDADSTARP